VCVSLGKLYAVLFACGFKLTQRKTGNLCRETYQAETQRIVCLQWTEKCIVQQTVEMPIAILLTGEWSANLC